MTKIATLALLALAAGQANAAAKSLADIKHVIMIMMENRSFQHYFGTMAGVRGFADPNVQINPVNNKPIWYQNVTSLTNATDYLLPYWLNYEDTAESYNKTQCMCAGANNWIPTHQAMNGGANDRWAVIDRPESWGYYRRQDIAYHFALAESWTVADMYHAAVMSNTDPNRWYWQSGTIGVPGGKVAEGSGGVVLDDNQDNGCVATNLDCLPLQWPAFAQKLDAAGVDWRSYQASYNWATNNGLFYFKAFQDAATNSSLYQRGLAFDGDNSLDAFKQAAAAGTLPEVSWAFPPGNLQEHPPFTPQDGAWWLNEIINATIHGARYNETVILLNWDEAGGWGDAVLPVVSPNGTAGEWFEDPYGELGYTWAGPGVRIPLIMMSPYTRGGHVFTERGDHSSILLFLEQWLAARGYTNLTVEDTLSDWRREHESNLVAAFDFENPDFSIPDLPVPQTPIQDSSGNMLGMYRGFCSKEWGTDCSTFHLPYPYGTQTEADALYYEDGFKGVRGYLTEGRYLVFEAYDHALAVDGSNATLVITPATADHSDIRQRWVLHALEAEGTTFYLSSATTSGRYMTATTQLATDKTDAEIFAITYLGSRKYALQKQDGTYLSISKADVLGSTATPHGGYSVFSVTYH